MALIAGADAPTFEVHGISVTGLAAPSRGATTNCAWRLFLNPGSPGPLHTIDREEIFIALSGQARATVDGSTYDVQPGDALVVPANTPFGIANPGADPFEAVVIMPAGALASFPGEEPFAPPWTL
jgi:mannose-6-phosphate isomerase-like protein (cupin superfamily)